MSLNVKNMPLPEVLKLIADEGHLNIAIGAGVTGNITLFVNETPVEELLRLAVDMAGAAVGREDGVYRVMTTDAFEQRYGRPYRDIRQRQFLELKHAQVQDVIGSLAPLRSPTGQLLGDPRSNGVLVIESPSRTEEIASVLEQIDRPLETRAYMLSSISPAECAERLQKYMPQSVQVEPDPEGKRVLLTASAPNLEQAGNLIALLDRSERIETRAFPLTYVAADTMRAAIEGMLTDGVGGLLVDPRSRQLIATDFPSQLDIISSRIQLLDVPKRQALIEARILNVSLNDEVKVGIDWEVLEESINDLHIRGTFPALGDETDGVRLNYGDLESNDFNVVVEALETFGRTELLSSPRIMVADGQTASIHVGSQVPYKTVDSREGANGTIDRFERVTIVDVGVKLDVTVNVHNDGTVAMLIRPEVSQVIGFSDNIPVVETATSSSMVSVRDGRTVILGGLNRIDEKDTRKGVPILCHIPLIKYLFSSTVKEKTRYELAILLTPRIVTGNEDYEGSRTLEEIRRDLRQGSQEGEKAP
jgi:type II secretory pathway component GspD/PulD (secretin)